MIMHPAIKLRHIRLFLAIAEMGSLTEVGRLQGVSQPAVSRSLAELEVLLGKSLFDRVGRRLVLTEAGAVFRRHAMAGVQALEAAAASVLPDQARPTLRIGVLPTVAARFFPQVALRFGEVAPEATLSVLTGPHFYLMGQLRSGKIDMMFGRMPGAGEIADLSFDHLFDEPIIAVIRAGHPLAGQPLAQIAGQVPLILPPEGAIIRQSVDAYLAATGLATLPPRLKTVAQAVGRGVVLGSDALWFISRGVVVEDLERGDLIAVPTQASYLAGSVGITRRQAEEQGPGLELLVQIARDLARG